ncbi:OmpA family protein [Flammeovirga sp. SubArs3]|uniref:OmpA family protein n=1 Tax=Flammeovirga sp. SubArs3 TaxID=2995316 RepID=UPI00248D17EA|nr:OmpA family protein [Flammeovirga sp. SubArs3]
MKKLLTVLLLMSFCHFILAQRISDVEIKNKEQRLEQDMEDLNYSRALGEYQKLFAKTESDELKKEYALKIAVCYEKVNKPLNSIEVYQKLLENDVALEGEYAESYGDALFVAGHYDEASSWYQKALDTSTDREQVYEKIKNIEDIRNTPKNIFYDVSGVSFNSELDDFGPVPFENGFLFISNRKGATGNKKSAWDGKRYLDIFYVDSAGSVSNFSKKLNTNFHEGSASITENGDMIAFTRTSRKEKDEAGVSTIQIYISEKNDKGEWDKPYSFIWNSDDYSTGHPSLTLDGSRLYFVSDKEGGIGGTDIYYSERSGDSWSSPILLGNDVNTEMDEKFPFINKKNQLFFSSNGRGGYGGLDFFMQDMNQPTPTPHHLRYPLNSSFDDFGGGANATGTAYISSNRITELDSSMNDNIYEVVINKFKGVVIDAFTRKPIPNVGVMINDTRITTSDSTGYFEIDKQYWTEKSQLIASLSGYTADTLSGVETAKFIDKNELCVLEIAQPYVEGYVKDTVSMKAVRARITITERHTGEKFEVYPDSTGYYRFAAKPETFYDMIAEKPKFFTRRAAVNTANNMVSERNFDVREIQGQRIRIYYDYDRAFIRDDASHALDTVVHVLSYNPTIKIELSAHTDSRGSEKYNFKLSERRAQKAYEYVVSKGISPERITYKGYGMTRPVVDCFDKECTEEEHQLNRRTEFYVTGYFDEEAYYGDDYDELEGKNQGFLMVDTDGEMMRISKRNITGSLATLEGQLSGYKVTIKDDQGKILNTKTTGSDGVFNITVEDKYKYSIEVLKDGETIKKLIVTSNNFDENNTYDVLLYL